MVLRPSGADGQKVELAASVIRSGPTRSGGSSRSPRRERAGRRTRADADRRRWEPGGAGGRGMGWKGGHGNTSGLLRYLFGTLIYKCRPRDRLSRPAASSRAEARDLLHSSGTKPRSGTCGQGPSLRSG